ncbi:MULTISPECIES: hypothetical protein [Cyanophyceae]|uniref:hypothetical protein n=1 Tax=Cyanophyceae TaxID=3028117 RepID=UPI001687D1A1|nr:hypothetical protein [Trichocoleus sp. FACHB-69]MBD1933310.1 hypothetical protein [Trichocoleus sp. FACHB-69]
MVPALRWYLKVGKLKFRSTGLKRGGGISGSIGGEGWETEIPVYGTQTGSSQALQNLIKASVTSRAKRHDLVSSSLALSQRSNALKAASKFFRRIEWGNHWINP